MPREMARRRSHRRYDDTNPGVETAKAGCQDDESPVRYRVVTAIESTYHETFEEAAEEYRLRRAKDAGRRTPMDKRGSAS